jgi:uncharacterized protein YodC (DUF2158 family)
MSSEQELGLGDLVKLKSGGPIMTLSLFQPGLKTVAVLCGYFVGTDYHEITVARAALVKVTEEELKQADEARKRTP